MPLIDREGIFRTLGGAQVSIEEYESGAVAAVFKFSIAQHWNNGTWEDWEQFGMDAYGRLIMVKKDRTPNDRAIATLKDVLKWNGDLGTFAAGWEVPAVQITVQSETYEGKQRFRVAWINNWDDDPERDLKPADPELLKKIQNSFGSQLRAAYGAKPVATAPATAPATVTVPATAPNAEAPKTQAPPKLKAAPKEPAPKSKIAPGSPVGRTATMHEAWAAYLAACPSGVNQAELEEEWFAILSKLFPGKELDQITASNWAFVIEEVPKMTLPF